MRPSPVVPVLVAAAALTGCKSDQTVEYSAAYTVKVTSALTDDGALDTDCVDAGREFNQTFTYQLLFDAADVRIDIDGEGFATGTRSGCVLNYQSAVWLEDADAADARYDGDVRWQITGTAVYEGATGGCDLDDGVDWLGTETIEVVESEDDSLPTGCTYALDTEGTFNGG